MTTKSRGGARPNAGRKTCAERGEIKQSTTLLLKLTPDLKARLKEQAESECTQVCTLIKRVLADYITSERTHI